MKAVILALALAGVAGTTALEAQILSTGLPAPGRTSGSIGSIDGTWRVVGRDGNGNTLYERRTRDGNGNIVIQRAIRDSNGNMRIISSRTVRDDNNRNRNCDYTRSTNSVGDIIFGRTSDVYCDDNGNRVDGGWYQVGRGRDNNSIYERRTRDANGRLVIQRARRNRDGTFTILSTRYANDNDKQWRKEQKKREKEYRKEQKRQEKEYRKSQRGDDDDYRYSRNDDYRNGGYVYSGYESGRNGKGHGKHKGRN
jgi:hypothetical protein